MPILDPSLYMTLLREFKEFPEDNDINPPFLALLQIASHNINRNIKTIENSFIFKKDLDVPNVNHFFYYLGIEISPQELKDPLIKNIYKFLFKSIKLASEEKKLKIRSKCQGSFHICTDKYRTKLFQIKIISNGPYAWFLSDTPIAILCLRDFNIHEKYSSLLKLEIDILAAAGYTLVLCFGGSLEYASSVTNLINDNQFSEIHFNLDFDLDYIHYYLLDEIEGYFYLYAPAFDHKEENETSSRLLYNIKELKKKQKRFTVIWTCNRTFKGLEEIHLLNTKPFAYCTNGFHHKYLPIRLSNVPLYDSKDLADTYIPSQTSGLNIGFINRDNFLRWKNFRVKIIFFDKMNQKNYTKKYIDFDDIHKIRIDLYVKDQLSLAKIDEKTLAKVNVIEKNINEKINERNGKEFIKEKILAIIKENKIEQSLQYVAYAYSFAQIKQEKTFFAHKTQIYTAYEACKRFIFKKKDKSQKGIVFQVETGEGKTCIVCLIAATLALMKKTVHVTSSNIKLSIRDFEESYKFFKLLDL